MKPLPIFLFKPKLHFPAQPGDGENDDAVRGGDTAPDAGSFGSPIHAAPSAHFTFAGFVEFAPIHQAWHDQDAAFAAAPGAGPPAPAHFFAGPGAPAGPHTAHLTAFSFVATGSLHFSPGTASAAPPPPPTLTQAQVTAFKDGLESTLEGIAGDLVSQVFADSLPVFGDNLLDAATAGVTQLGYVTTLKDLIVTKLGTLTGEQTETALETALNDALAGYGTANLDFANPNDIKLSFTTTKTLAAFSIPLDGQIGVPGLGLSATGAAESTLRYTLDFTTGLDATGFYLGTGAGAGSFHIIAETRLPTFSAGAELSALKFSATDNAANPTLFQADFNVALKDTNNDGHLRDDELGGVLLEATLTGNASINLKLASNLGTAVLPDIAADLSVNWHFANAAVNPALDSTSFGDVPTIAFKNVTLGLSSFFNDFVAPVFDKVQILTEPLQPLVDVLTKPIGFLRELTGEDVSLLDLAGGIGALDQPTKDRLELYGELITFLNMDFGGGSTRIDLGDFSIGTQDPRGAGFHLVNVVPQPTRVAPSPSNQDPDANTFISAKDGLPGGGLVFPILENPLTAISLLFGKPVDFFTYHVPGLNVPPQGINQFFRLFGPFGVRLQATVEAHAFLDIGYDSSGVTQFATTGDAEDIFNGFYVVNAQGPLATVTASLEAFAAANVGFAELGVGGGITGNLNIFLNDLDSTPGDGRVHLAELSNDCLIFSLSGEVTAGLSAYLTIDLGLFEETYEEDFGHEVLLSFNSLGCTAAGEPGVPVLAHTSGASIELNVGADTSLRQIGNPADSLDDFFVGHVSGGLGDETVGVMGNGLRTEDGDPVNPQEYLIGANGRISADGGEKDDSLVLAADVLSRAELHGGEGNDRLIGGAGDDELFGENGLDLLIGGGGADTLNGGADQDLLDGQAGNDTLLGGNEADTLAGGAGADILNGGAGYDTASYFTAAGGVLVDLAAPGNNTGDAQGDSYVSIERYVGSPHADILRGTAGSDNLGGGAGADALDGREGDDLLSGDAGADQLIGGAGNDFATYSVSPAAVSVSLFTGTGSGGDAAGDTLAGIENLQGSDLGDTLEGDNGPNWLRGLNGANLLRGLGGDDLLEGGKDGDTLEGGDDSDTLRASTDVASLDPLVSGGADTLRGGAGNDFLYGDAGGDLLDGGADNDQLFGGKDDDTLLGGTGDDMLDGGAGNDFLDAGAGYLQQFLYGRAGNDHLASPGGFDYLDGGDGDDLLEVAGGTLNGLSGGAGRDTLRAGNGGDTLDGGTDDDILEAGDGANTVFGGAGNDTISAGTGADDVDGGTGNDSIASGANQDTIHGGEGNDTIDAGAGHDLVFGDAGNDLIDGGIGRDTIDGGEGDDTIYVGTLREATQDPDRLDRIDGGAGYDVVSADLSNQTIPITIIAGQTWSYDFADGAYVRNFESIQDFATGSGDDVLILLADAPDRFSGSGYQNTLFTGAGNDTVFSGPKSDYVDAGEGDDFVNGGEGHSAENPNPLPPDFTPYPRFGNGGIVEGLYGNQMHGGPGVDTLSFEGDEVRINFTPTTSEMIGVDVNLGTGAVGRAATGTIFSGFENLIGTTRVDRLVGDAGPNTISPGRDLAYGTYIPSSIGGPDSVDGAGGDDTLFFDARLANPANPFGLSGNFTLSGGHLQRNVPSGTPSQIYTLYFGDVNASNIEHFHIIGTAYTDDLQGDINADKFFGEGGNDILDGGAGDDLLDGGAGDDILRGASGADTISGGDGNDTIGGGTGADTLDGGAGDDRITAIAYLSDGSADLSAVGNDTVGQADRIDGGTGTDTLSANFGYQTGAVVWSSASPANVEFADGTYFRNIEVIDDIRLGSGNDVLTQLGRVDNTWYLGAGNDTVNAGLGVDFLYAEAGGDDVLIVDWSVGDDAALGGMFVPFNSGYAYARNDTALGVQRDRVQTIGFERFQITGTSKADALFGGVNADILNGGAGNDTIDTGIGNDTVDAGPGDDRVTAGGSRPFITPEPAQLDRLDGGPGNDTLVTADFSLKTSAILFNSGTGVVDNAFADGAYFRGFETILSINTGSGNDAITQLGRIDNEFLLNAGNDTVNAGLGLDSVVGGAGDDTLILDYSQGDDANLGGLVTSVAQFQTVLYRKNTGTNQDVDRVTASEFEHYILTGTTKNDSVIGGAGDDVLNPGTRGNDSVQGGGGNDLLVVDWSAVTTGANGIRYSAFNATAGSGVFATADALNYKVTFSTIERFDLRGTELDDLLQGGNLADTLRGGGGPDTITGGAGNDTLMGGAGNDSLDGGDGLDVLDGGDGDDVLVAGPAGTGQWAVTVLSFSSQYSTTNWSAAQTLGVPNTASYGDFPTAWTASGPNVGNQQLTLGFATPVHATSIVVRETYGNGFVYQIDLLDTADQLHTVFAGVDSSATGAPVNFTTAFAATEYLVKGAKIYINTNLRSDFEEIDAVQLLGAGGPGETLLGGAGNDALTGTAGDDTLDGGTGADTMNGGAGDDTYLVDSIADIVSENVGAGNDTVNAVIDFNLGPNLENLALAGRAVQGTGNALANIITGNARNNVLDGGDGNDVLTGGTGLGLAGSQEIDRLIGGAGADTFVLGDAGGRFYDDRSSLTPGVKGYAQIDDFTPSQGDRLKLKGAEAEYFIGASPVAGAAGTALFHDSDLDGLLDPAHDELLAVLASPETLDFQHVIHDAIFV